MQVENLIVGAGIAGIVLARRLAEERNQKVLIVERRNHVGGYCYDYRNEDGILIHKYGPHIFRTNSSEAWKYLSRFTDWVDYQHKVLSYVGGKYYPMPINLDTINLFLGTSFSSEDVLRYFEHVKVQKETVENVKDRIESQVGSLFYQSFFENYTYKQWGIAPEKLPKEIVSRIPIRSNRDDRYFTVRYQGLPTHGYTEMMLKMLHHPNIHVMLNTEYKEIKDQIQYSKLFYCGSIDEYFDYCYGKLPYRCVSFELQRLETEYYQPVAVVNYPNDYDYTRITEFKHFTDHKSAHTVIAKEYSCSEGDPSYPIPLKKNLELYQKYVGLCNSISNSPVMIGRLGQYRYYSMDQVVQEILKLGI